MSVMVQIILDWSVDKFHAGYSACAAEVGRVLASQPGVEVTVGARLMAQLGHRLESGQTKLSVTVPSCSSSRNNTVSPQQPCSPLSDLDLGYNSGRESSPSPSSRSEPSPSPPSSDKSVWRPF